MNLPPLLPGEDYARSDVASGEYERYYRIRPGDRVLDLGAHVGYFTEHAILSVGPMGRVVAFEPESVNFERLMEKFRKTEVVTLVKAGAMDFEGEMPLWTNRENSGAHAFTKYNPVLQMQSSQCVDIGQWCRKHDFAPDFVKIDTEGSEVRILKSLFAAGCRAHIALEAHGVDLWEECKALFLANNYAPMAGNCVVGINWGIPVSINR